MFGQAIVILAAAWAVFLGPTLCTGGVLSHACDCVPTQTCGHEPDCTADPCGQVLAPRDDTGRAACDGAAAVPPSAAARVEPSRLVAGADRPADSASSPVVPHPERYHDSGLPLLN